MSKEKTMELRGTGRTTRMLEDAIRAARQGKPVVVVVNSIDFVKSFVQYAICIQLGVVFYTPSSTPWFDWEMVRAPGWSYDTEVFVDHFVIESRFAHLLEMLHRWD